MSLSSVQFGPYAAAQEIIAAGVAGNGSPFTLNAGLGSNVGETLSVGTTGQPNSVNVVAEVVIALGAAGTLTIDLTAIVVAGVTKTFAKVRGVAAQNTAAADAGAGSNYTITPGGTNGWTNGPFVAAGTVVKPNSKFLIDDLNTAAAAVSGANKTITITAGATGANGKILFIGE